MKIKFMVLGLMSLSFASMAENSGVEQLMGVSVDDSGITFQVNSKGCTVMGDFAFDVEERLERMGPHLPALEHHYYISVKRLRTDECNGDFPYGTKLFKSFPDLGFQSGKFHVTNPIGGEKIITVP